MIQDNLFAYCFNNPINMLDPTGEIAILTCVLIGAGIGLLIGGAFGGHRAVKKGYVPNDGWKFWKISSGQNGTVRIFND